MLEQKQIKIPCAIKIYFLSIENQRFLVFNNIESKVFLSIKIHKNIFLFSYVSFYIFIEVLGTKE
jgi:hypothetical protein